MYTKQLVLWSTFPCSTVAPSSGFLSH